MNTRRRLKNMNMAVTPAGRTRRPRDPEQAPAGGPRKRAPKAEGSARLFADFLAAFMTLSPEQLANLE